MTTRKAGIYTHEEDTPEKEQRERDAEKATESG
jgi:hypothetical protein